jgi:putative flippase GtrA
VTTVLGAGGSRASRATGTPGTAHTAAGTAHTAADTARTAADTARTAAGAGHAAADTAGAEVHPGRPRRGVFAPVSGMIDRLRDAMGVLYREMLKFGVIGAVAFVVDIGVFNLLSTDLWPGSGPGPLDGHEKIAKAVSVSVATLVSWLGNRLWSFRHRRQAAAHRELVLFVIMNVAGLLIGVACLTISHDLLGFTSSLADNVSGNLIGTALGTLFRFWAYRAFVFTEFRDPQAQGLAPASEVPGAASEVLGAVSDVPSAAAAAVASAVDELDAAPDSPAA